MHQFRKNYEIVADYLPDHRDVYRIPRQFLVDVLKTVVGDPFDNWIKQQISQRNNLQRIVRNLDIAVSSAALDAFHRSDHISVSNQPSFFITLIFHTDYEGQNPSSLKEKQQEN
jgi:hypothetical protein